MTPCEHPETKRGGVVTDYTYEEEWADRTYEHIEGDHGYHLGPNDNLYTGAALDWLHQELHRRRCYGSLGPHTETSR